MKLCKFKIPFKIQNYSGTLNLLYYLSYIAACSVIPVMGKNCFIINGCLTSSSASEGSNCFIQKSSNLQLEDGIIIIEIYLKTYILKKKTAILKSYGIRTIMLPPYHPGFLEHHAQFEWILEGYKLPGAKRWILYKFKAVFKA